MSYQDVTAGSHLRIMLPLLEGSNSHLTFGPSETNGNEITLSARNLTGFQLLHYSAEGDQTGKIQLKFVTAEITKVGHTHTQMVPPPMPFPLPQTKQFVRLVFLVRVSEADHNMAIIAAGDRTALASFTTQVSRNPAACQTANKLFCVWVPQGVAVRPE
jgi:hypothetical protein